MNFTRKQKVRCVDKRPTRGGFVPAFAKTGETLEVESVWPGGRYFGFIKLKGWFGYFNSDRFEAVR